MNYYNEFDPKTAAWLRELIHRRIIPNGIVDERSIIDVSANDLRGFTQCHFFAGIGGWSYALQLAGWPADRPVWTGSCPCQPFSTAGKGLAQKDERHLWPVFFDLIRQCRPPIVFGEQVASAAVVGHSDKNKSVQSVRDREALFRILQELKRGAAGNMQGLCEDGGASAEAEQAQDGKGRLQKMEGREARSCSCERGEAQGQELRDTLRPLGREHSGKDRQGGLRSDGDTLRPIDSPLLERTLTGSNHTQSGIHHGEYPSGPICSECHGELLGVTEDCGSVEGYSWVEERSLGQIIGVDREEAPRTLEECWLDGVSADLEAEGYACGATVLGAHSVNSPHQRQRLYWVAYSQSSEQQRQWPIKGRVQSGPANSGGLEQSNGRRCIISTEQHGDTLPDSADRSSRGKHFNRSRGHEWSDFQLVHCRDGKARRVPTEPAFFPLAYGAAARVVRLRGYGNAIVPQTAAEFVSAYLEVLGNVAEEM